VQPIYRQMPLVLLPLGMLHQLVLMLRIASLLMQLFHQLNSLPLEFLLLH
jgi:hypothetical protein